MINELFVLSRKKIFKYLILVLVVCSVISFKPIQTSSQYDNFYKTYANHFELLKIDNLSPLLPECQERHYLYNHIKYIIHRSNSINKNIEMLEKKTTSILFKDDLDKIYHELSYEKTRFSEEVKFYDTYKNEIILNNNLLIYCLYVLGLVLIISIFYDDIKNGQLQIFKTYKNNLKYLFKSKLFLYLSLMFICTLVFMLAEMFLIKGNYSVYNIESLNETYLNLSLIEFVACKYINAFVNTCLLSTMLISVLLISRNLVVTMTGAFLTMLVSFFAHGQTMSNLKYFNLYYLLFLDKLQYNGMNKMLNIIKLVLCILFIILFYVLYVKDFSVDIFKKSKKVILKTTIQFLHISRELLIPSKGILAIAVVLLFSIYQFNLFKMTYDYQELSYQNFKAKYLGPVNEDKYQEILEDYDEIVECYDKFMIIQEKVNNDPENSQYLLMKNEEIITKAQNIGNIGKLRAEFEEAMKLGLNNLVDNRGANLIVMKEQLLYLIECLCILIFPLVFVYVELRMQMTLPSYSTVITPSKIGEKKYLLLSDSLFILLTSTNTIIMVIGHILKIKKVYPINLSYTLKDILFVNINLSIANTLLIFGIIVVLGIFIVSKVTFHIIQVSVFSRK